MGLIPTSYQTTGVFSHQMSPVNSWTSLWHKVTHSEIRSRTGITTIESMLLHRQLHWLGHVIRMPHCVLNGQLRLGHRSVSGQKKRFKDHIKSILKKCNIPFSLAGTIVLQFSDAVISMLQCSVEFRILIINAHFVADNATHALASSATAKPTFNVEEEVVVIRNGWTPKKKKSSYIEISSHN